jgi:hypothetical protein
LGQYYSCLQFELLTTYFNPRLAADLFFLFRSTGSKQTLNGLFYVVPDPKAEISELFFQLNHQPIER